MKEDLITIFKLSYEDYNQVLKFAIKLWYAGKPKGDWRSTGTKRDIGKYITDTSIGKLAEIAFKKFLEKNWEIRSEIDFNIYPGSSNIDRGDLVKVNCHGMIIEPQIKIDVKSTKPGSLWAMIDAREFTKRKYDAYVWIKVDLPLNHLARPIFEAVRNNNMQEIEQLIPSLETINAEVAGFAWREDVEKWKEFKKGEHTYDPNDPKKKLFDLKTDNKACPINGLNNSKDDWTKLIEQLCGLKL